VILEPKERRGTAFAITNGLGIGREPDNAIVILHDAYISGHHAKLTVANGHVLIDDLASKNGTYLNGTRLAEQRYLHTGDRIQVGYTVLEAQ
jgi:pSer/pThr/pTyr-binding forkhead associated (FHA) protein